MGDTSAVGSYPAGASPYGAMDMAGNVYEWVNDWFSYDDDYYANSPYENPPGPTTGMFKVERGGSHWFEIYEEGILRTAFRGFMDHCRQIRHYRFSLCTIPSMKDRKRTEFY